MTFHDSPILVASCHASIIHHEVESTKSLNLRVGEPEILSVFLFLVVRPGAPLVAALLLVAMPFVTRTVSTPKLCTRFGKSFDWDSPTHGFRSMLNYSGPIPLCLVSARTQPETPRLSSQWPRRDSWWRRRSGRPPRRPDIGKRGGGRHRR